MTSQFYGTGREAQIKNTNKLKSEDLHIKLPLITYKNFQKSERNVIKH